MVQKAFPPKEEVPGAFKRIKRVPGDNPSFADLSVQESSGSSSFKFVFAKRGRKSPIDVAGAPPGDLRSDLVNCEKETNESVHHHEQLANGAAEVFSLPLSHEQIKADPGEASTYQSLARQGKVSRKKPSKAALYHETEKSQLQEFARQQQEIKRGSRQAQEALEQFSQL